MRRSVEIDVLKGIGIILMVLGHCCPFLEKPIYVFHMALFFLAAGFCFNEKNANSIKTVSSYFLRKLKSFYIPYVLMGIVLLSFTNLFIILGLRTNNPLFEINAINSYNGLTEWLTVGAYIKNIVRLLCFGFLGDDVPFFGATWFLRVLFLAEIFYVVLVWGIKKIPISERSQKNIITVVTFGCLLLSYGLQVNNIEIRILGISVFDKVSRSLTALCMLDFGARSKYSIEKLCCNGRNCVLLFAGCLVIICALSTQSTVYLSKNDIVNPLFFIIGSLAGYLMVFCLSRIICIYSVEKIFTYIGKHTLSILFLHFLAFKPVTVWQVSLFGLPKYMRASFPVLYTDFYWVILYMVCGLGIPLGLQFIFNRIKEKVKIRKTIA